MKIAIKDFIGVHNFKSFVSEESVKENYEREIYDAYIEEIGDKVAFVFRGSGFMKYQVRNMVGTLFKIGKGKLKEDGIRKIFADEKRKKDVMTIKSEGLYLTDVVY